VHQALKLQFLLFTNAKAEERIMNEFSALIPLRIGSKGIYKKNIKKIAGKPLCEWVVRAACRAKHISEVYVSTESSEISQIIENLKLGVKVISRPPELATDIASTESVMLHALKYISSNNLVTIQATSPLLSERELDDACERFVEQKNNSLLSAVRLKRFLWSDDGKPLNYRPESRPRRQDFDGTFIENGAFYISDCKLLAETQTRLHGNVGIFQMPEDTFIEIDTPEDWLIVEKIMGERLSHAA
jgi:CMP-N-acetylneuraminic acid synthetase